MDSSFSGAGSAGNRLPLLLVEVFEHKASSRLDGEDQRGPKGYCNPHRNRGRYREEGTYLGLPPVLTVPCANGDPTLAVHSANMASPVNDAFLKRRKQRHSRVSVSCSVCEETCWLLVANFTILSIVSGFHLRSFGQREVNKRAQDEKILHLSTAGLQKQRTVGFHCDTRLFNICRYRE